MRSLGGGPKKWIGRDIVGIALIGVCWWGSAYFWKKLQVRDPECKVVVLGFDGASPQLCRQFMSEGLLPNLSALAKGGAFAELETINPSMSPVSWSSFAVGGDPGYRGVYDFLTRTPDNPTYMPSHESFVGQVGPRFLLGIPLRRPKAINRRGGTAFWEYAANDGIKTELVLVPVTFAPPKLPNGLAISGLGVPDICGTQATYETPRNGDLRIQSRRPVQRQLRLLSDRGLRSDRCSNTLGILC